MAEISMKDFIASDGHKWTWKDACCEACGVSFCGMVRVGKQARRFCSKSCTVKKLKPYLNALRGDAHPGWKGDDMSERSGRCRALRLYPNIGPCEQCGNPKAERHHADGNTINNAPSNISILCRHCHMEKDGRLLLAAETLRAAQPLGNIARWGKR
jgi:hypothetical protein